MVDVLLDFLQNLGPGLPIGQHWRRYKRASRQLDARNGRSLFWYEICADAAYELESIHHDLE